LALLVRWIRRFLSSNPGASADVLAENATPISMGPTQMTKFSADMSTIGRQFVASNLADELPKPFNIMIEDSHDFSGWIILPNGNTVMWYRHKPIFNPAPNLAGFASALFETGECGQDQCSGWIVLPDGSILKAQ
jgi:hypothetical protein